ncbi:hypothetical protein HZH68_016092 [Vespula germanica]|uniref:EF-hand domain-containing protein n=1 Tax=Vespula germanica TaxID=30212 RepID=A0A834J493_VESGE|nr:hypothetical protein HZH68_016092 [Vespula germanica]
MVNVLFKTIVCSLMSKGLVKKRITPTLFRAFSNVNQEYNQTDRKLQFYKLTKRLYSERKIHNRQILTAIDEIDSDIDSDYEQERGQTPFWRRKMRTLHSHLDVNKDGIIGYDDFMLLAERFSKIGNLSPGETIEFKKILTDLWEELWGEVSPYNLICIEKYLEEMQHVLNDPSLKKKYHSFLPFLFKAIDKDQNGEISIKEYKLFFKCLGLENDHAVVSFNYIDINEDGKLSLEEFVTVGRDFFLTEDHTRPSKHFWGPLVD